MSRSPIWQLCVVVPMHNYVTGAMSIMDWLCESKPVNELRWHCWIYDDRTDPMACRVVADKVSRRDNFTLAHVPSGEGGGPRYALSQIPLLATAGPFVGSPKGTTAALVVESDCWPDDDVFVAMKEALEEPPLGDSVVSTSPMYHHPHTKELCYPWNPNWTKEGHRNCYARSTSEIFGDVALADAVPFLFSLWRPWTFREISKQMPILYHLDSRFGERLTEMGHQHLRLLDHSVGHHGGGKRSQKDRGT